MHTRYYQVAFFGVALHCCHGPWHAAFTWVLQHLIDRSLYALIYGNNHMLAVLVCFVTVQPETVAAYLVPRVRTVVARKSLSTYIKYLTIPRALGKFLTAPTKGHKYFNKQGMPGNMIVHECMATVETRQLVHLHCT